jgi:hypothetical protein
MSNLFKKSVASLCCLTILAGCSTASKDIPATYVSPVQYSDYDCDQLKAEIIRINTRVASMSGKLDKNRENDNLTTGAALILFWPAVFFLGGTKEQEAEFARVKGEAQAVEQVSIQKKCGFQKAADPSK